MSKRFFILLIVFVAIVASVNAQVRPGIKLGYNLGGVVADYAGNNEKNPYNLGDPDNFHMRSGFQMGMIADCPINEAFAIQPGARFSMQGFSDRYKSGGTTGSKVTRNFSLYYLQIPVYAQYRWNVYEETNVLFQAGPYFGLGLFGRQSITTAKSTSLTDDQKKITFGKGKDIQNAFDYGIGAGVGIEFFRFQFVVAYDYGLSKMAFDKPKAGSGPYKIDMRNHNLSITLAVIFGRRDPLQNQRDF